jgi:GYF domain 2
VADRWYYAHGARRLGPFTARELSGLAAAGKLLPADTVWKDGMEKGVLAEKVKNLFPPAPAGGGAADPAGTAPAPAASPHLPATPSAAVLEAGPMTLTFRDHVDGVEVELAPDLPAPVFYCTESWQADRIGAMALYCSDGRWGEAFDEFCHRHLQLPRYDRLALPGGPACLATAGGGTSAVEVAHQQLDFLVRVHELERIVLITHYGCAFYGEQLQREPRECLPLQMEDVRLAAARLRGWYSGLRVDAYLAMRTGRCLGFHAVEVNGDGGEW